MTGAAGAMIGARKRADLEIKLKRLQYTSDVRQLWNIRVVGPFESQR
jgi:hypothetical protein